MFRTLFIAASIVAITTTVFAQADVVAARKALMGETGKHMYRALPDMIKGATPYNQTAVDAAFAQMNDAAQKLPALYAASTKDLPPSGRYSVSQKMWANKPDFDAKLANYAKDIAAARPRVKDIGGLKEAYAAIGKNCDSCHDAYRVRN
jgi:cytochrome c556